MLNKPFRPEFTIKPADRDGGIVAHVLSHACTFYVYLKSQKEIDYNRVVDLNIVV